MSQAGGTRSKRNPQRGAVLLGLAGGMLVVAGGFVGAYYILGTKSEAAAATQPSHEPAAKAHEPAAHGGAVAEQLKKTVDVVAAGSTTKLTWADLGAEVDASEGTLRLDRDKAAKALLTLKAKVDRSPTNAYLDLEDRVIHDDTAGEGLDVYGSMPRLEAAARTGAAKVELATVAVPASVTKATLGISDISTVMGHHLTRFAATDRDRNFNLKLAASKINGVVLQPGVEWSFNAQVGERSEKEGYKIAHVITAGEMVDGLAGGTCQISTTLFGAAFFAGIDIVKTTNHSRPSAYTPLGFDATVVWPDTDLKLKNPYDFPVAIHYVVANGEALVEILGPKRPYDKIVFERHVVESTPFDTQERLDDDMPDGQTSLDQAGFNGYKLERYRRFYKGKKLVKSDKWVVTYKPVTEYVRRGTNKDPSAKMPPEKPVARLKEPTGDDFKMEE